MGHKIEFCYVKTEVRRKFIYVSGKGKREKGEKGIPLKSQRKSFRELEFLCQALKVGDRESHCHEGTALLPLSFCHEKRSRTREASTLWDRITEL